MAAEYKGLIIKLGIDSKDILEGLEKVDKELKGTKKELNALEKSLQLKWDNKKFEEAQKLAQKRVEETKKKAELLKKAIGEIESQGMGKVSDEFKSLQSELNKAEKAAQTAEKQFDRLANLKLDSLGKRIDNVGEKITGLGKKMIPVSAAATAGLGFAAKAAIDYEQAFVGVTKTVDGTKEQLQGMNSQLREMSTKIPVSAVELAELAQTAGQLGIKTNSIIGFTRTIADLGVASNLSGEEGASMLAKFANVSQMPQSDFDRLGSSIVELGNNSASTEKDIMEMGTRLVGAGTQAGMSESDIIGISAALSSVGLEAEAGGSAFSKLINEMNTAVQTGSIQLKNFASISGVSVAKFTKLFKEDASEALTLFVQGIKAAGNKAIPILDQIGITEIRMRDALLRSASAGDLLKQSIDMSSDAWKNNAALADEATKAYGSTYNQLQITKNEITNTAIDIGNIMLPVIRNLANEVKDAAKWFSGLSNTTQTNIIKAIALAAALAPVALAVGGVIKTVSGLVTGIKALKTAAVAFKAANDAATLSQAALNAVMNANPYVLCTTVLVSLAAAVVGYKVATADAAESTAELSGELKNLKDSYDSTKDSTEQTEQSTLAELSAVEKMIPRLEELSGKTNRTAEEKAELNGIVERLNAAIPNLNLALNDETGALNRQISVVWNAVTAWKALARAKAAEKLAVAAEESRLKAEKIVSDEKQKSTEMRFDQEGRPVFYSAGEFNPTVTAAQEEAAKYQKEADYYEGEYRKAMAQADATMPPELKGGGSGKTPTIYDDPGNRTGGGSSRGGGSSKGSTGKSDAEKKAEEERKRKVDRYDQNIENTEDWNQNYYDKLKAEGNLAEAQELKSIQDRAGRYRKYAQDIVKINFMTEDEKLKRFKDYSQKAEKLEQETAKMKRDIQADTAKAYVDNINETEAWNKRHYDNRKKLDNLTEAEEIKSIEERQDRYIKYSQDIMGIEGLTQEEKLKLQKEYREKAEDTEIELYELKKSITEREIADAERKANEMLQIMQTAMQKQYDAQRTAIAEQQQLEIDDVNKRIAAQEKLLQVKINAIDEEIAARRRLREDAEQDDKITKIQEQIKRTQAQIEFARDAETREQLQRELQRQQNDLKNAIQSKEDTEFERQKQAEKDAINAEIERLREKAQQEQESINNKYSDVLAGLESDAERKRQQLENTAVAQAAVSTQVTKINNTQNSSTVMSTINNSPTVVLKETMPATYVAGILNKIIRG